MSALTLGALPRAGGGTLLGRRIALIGLLCLTAVARPTAQVHPCDVPPVTVIPVVTSPVTIGFCHTGLDTSGTTTTITQFTLQIGTVATAAQTLSPLSAPNTAGARYYQFSPVAVPHGTFTATVTARNSVGGSLSGTATVCVACSFVVTIGPPPGPTVYAAPSTSTPPGNDSNPGTLAAPFRTLAKGVSVLTPGATLLVRAGTYVESLIDNIPSGTSWTAPVRIAAYPGETVWMRPTTGSFVLHLQNTSKYIEFDGINMDGDGVISNAVKIESFIGTNTHTPNHIRLKNAEVMGASTTADTAQSRSVILVTDPNGVAPGNNEFINLRIHRYRSRYVGTDNQGSVGLYIQGPNNLVDGCEFYDFRFAAFQIYSAYGFQVNGTIVRNSSVHDPTRVAGEPHVGMVVYTTNAGTQIYNNLIYNIPSDGSSAIGVQFGSGASNVNFANNTIYNTAGIGLQIPNNVNTVRNVIAFGGSPNTSLIGTTVQATNLFGTDPLFVNAAGANFHLQAGSPARNTGTTISTIPTDFYGVVRPQEGLYDIGAAEYAP